MSRENLYRLEKVSISSRIKCLICNRMSIRLTKSTLHGCVVSWVHWVYPCCSDYASRCGNGADAEKPEMPDSVAVTYRPFFPEHTIHIDDIARTLKIIIQYTNWAHRLIPSDYVKPNYWVAVRRVWFRWSEFPDVFRLVFLL